MPVLNNLRRLESNAFRGIAAWAEPNLDLPLAMFRWALGLAVLVAYVQLIFDYDTFFGRIGMCPRVEWHLIRAEHTLSYFKFVSNERACKAIAFLAFVPMTTFWWGISPRISALASWYFLVSLHDRCPLILDGSDFVIRLMLFLFIFARSDRRLSPISPLAKSHPGDSFSIRLMQLQLCLIYVSTGLQKLYGSKWWTGTALAYTVQLDSFSRANWTFLAENELFVNMSTYMTLFFELSFIYLVWPKSTRPFILALGIAMHAGIEIIMYVPMFSWIMVASYLVFFERAYAERVLTTLIAPYARWTRARGCAIEANRANANIVKLVQRLDIFNAVAIRDANSDIESVDSRVSACKHIAVSLSGRPAATGARAWARLAVCVPSLLVWLPLLALPNGVRAMEQGFARASR
jgi:hypothetical protein